jgi:CRISPR-associated protein Csm4
MKRYIIKLYFHNSVHFGNDIKGIGEESAQSVYHSDTFFSALCNVWAQIDWHLKKQGCIAFPDALDMFVNGNPPFKISSAFPFDKEGLYLPMPMVEPAQLKITHKKYKKNNQKFSKELKKILYIRVKEFKELTEQKENLHNIIYDEKIFSHGIPGQIRPHTPVSRINNESNIYHSENTFFIAEQKGIRRLGIYVIVELNEEVISHDNLSFVLKHLSKYGIGGNRNIGQGALHNELKLEEIPEELSNLFNRKNNNAVCIISLYYPLNVNNTEPYHYSLTPRKGWIGSNSVKKTAKKKMCFMFSEGSVFKKIDQGKLVDVRPYFFNNEHPIYQYGYQMSIPVRID